MNSRQRVHAAMSGQRVDRTPLTPIFMAWAAHFIGRPYRDYYLHASALVEAQLAVAVRFGLDQLSAISDPWREASAFGMELDYPEQGVGIPRDYLLKDASAIAALKPIDPLAHPRTRDRLDAVAMLSEKSAGQHSILGWVEGPIAEYSDLRGLEPACMDLMDEPQLFHQAAEPIVASAIAFAREQVARGADVIGVGDAAASLLSPDTYAQHVLPWQQRLITAIHESGAKVKLHICGNVGRLLPHLSHTGADAIDIDWMVPLPAARAGLGDSIAICGNFDPAAVLLRGTAVQVAEAARQCVRQGSVPAAGGASRFLLQPGCEVPPGTPIENIDAFCDLS